MAIVCKSAAEIEKMRESGRIVRQVLDHVRAMVAPGVTTMDLERAAEQRIKDLGAKPAFKGYYDYPCVLCTSVNEEIVHGIPSEKRTVKEGDIVSIDCGVVLDGYYGDAAITVPVDAVKPELRKLLTVTEESLYRGIEQVRIGNSVGDVGARFKSMLRPTASAWFESLLATESARGCTKIPRCQTSEPVVMAPDCERAWYSPSNPW